MTQTTTKGWPNHARFDVHNSSAWYMESRGSGTQGQPQADMSHFLTSGMTLSSTKPIGQELPNRI